MPFERWVQNEFLDNGYSVKSYVAIRSDESFREGLKSKKDITTVLPFVEHGVDKGGVLEILENSGLGLRVTMIGDQEVVALFASSSGNRMGGVTRKAP